MPFLRRIFLGFFPFPLCPAWYHGKSWTTTYKQPLSRQVIAPLWVAMTLSIEWRQSQNRSHFSICYKNNSVDTCVVRVEHSEDSVKRRYSFINEFIDLLILLSVILFNMYCSLGNRVTITITFMVLIYKATACVCVWIHTHKHNTLPKVHMTLHFYQDIKGGIYLVCFVWRPHKAVLSVCSLLCSQGSCLTGSGDHMNCQRIYPKWLLAKQEHCLLLYYLFDLWKGLFLLQYQHWQ